MAGMVGAGSGQSQVPGALCVTPMWVEGAQLLGAAFSCVLIGSWFESRQLIFELATPLVHSPEWPDLG